MPSPLSKTGVGAILVMLLVVIAAGWPNPINPGIDEGMLVAVIGCKVMLGATVLAGGAIAPPNMNPEVGFGVIVTF